MGFFERVSNILKSNANSALDGLEDDRKMLDQSIRDMEDSLSEAKRQAATVIGTARNLNNEVKETELELDDIENKILECVKAGNDDLAKKFIAKKNALSGSLATMKISAEKQNKTADELKVKIQDLEDKVNQTKAKREEILTRLATADAEQKSNEILANVTSKTNSISIDKIEEHVAKKEAQAAGLAELAPEDLDREFAKMAASGDVDDQLAKYKSQIKTGD